MEVGVCVRVRVCVLGGGVPTADFYSSVTVMCVTVPIEEEAGLFCSMWER